MDGSSVVDLDMIRVEREDDNSKITPEELMRLVVKQLRDGTIGAGEGKPVAAFACVILRNADGSMTFDKFRCGMSQVEEIGYVETYKLQIQEKWRNV